MNQHTDGMPDLMQNALPMVDDSGRPQSTWCDKMMQRLTLLICWLLLFSGIAGAAELVLLDIGHSAKDRGASSPDGRLSETAFWYKNAGEVKRLIEKAGYRCIVCNRGNAPTQEPLAAWAREAGVVHLNKPDRGGVRYPSKYYPNRIGAGMVSADYGIEQKPVCMVFLHLNSTGGWMKAPIAGLVIHSRVHGKALGESLQQAFNRELFEQPGGVTNGGKGCRTIIRYRKEETAAGWLNALDDAGIPAAVVEALYVNNRSHAAFLLTDVGGKKTAQTVAHGIIQWLQLRQTH